MLPWDERLIRVALEALDLHGEHFDVGHLFVEEHHHA